jgi:hypothetical protein
MKLTRNFVLPLAALFFGLMLMPQAAHAQIADCPTEPTQTTIADGEVFAGANCTLKTAGDIDSFVFSANEGDVYEVAAALNGFNFQICLTLYDPNGAAIDSGCTNPELGQDAVVFNQTLTMTGSYSIDVTESSSGTQNYAVSLERIYPVPPNAQLAKLSTSYTGDIAALSQANAFSFALVTTGQFRVTATLPNNPTTNLCLTVFSATGSSVGSGCTNPSLGQTSVVVNFTPTQAGTGLALVTAIYDDGTLSGYTLEVACVSGNCGKTQTPPCTLKDSLNYNSSTNTLTMNFTVGNTSATTWNVWLTEENTLTQMFSVAQPITNPPVVIPKTTSLSPSGIAGVLTTLTTPAKGIICSNFSSINTGTPTATMR